MRPLRVDFITNQAPHYRSALWQQLAYDEALDSRFVFGQASGKSIQQIDFDQPFWLARSSRLRRVRNLHFRGVLVWQWGVLKRVLSTDAQVLVMLGQMYVLSMWLVAFLARRRGISLVFWGHGAYGRDGPLKRWFRKRFLSLGDVVLVYGHYARRLLIDDGFEPDRIRVVYNSLDHAQHVVLRATLTDPKFVASQDWFEDSSLPLLLFVGRLTRQKSLDKLIATVGRLAKKNRRFNLLFVGDGPERSKLEELARIIPGQVHFVGACYDEVKLGRLIANADLCVSPGEVGLTAIHALSFGTPVCTHGDLRNQMPEAEAVIDGTTGILFKRSASDLDQAILNWFDRNADRDAVRKACHKVIDQYWNTENQCRIIRDTLFDVVRSPS